MSRKTVNILIAINITLGIITILILSNLILTTLLVTVDSVLYMKTIYATMAFLFFSYNAYILSILRSKTNHNKKIEFNKKSKQELLTYFIIFFVSSLFVYLFSILFKDYSIKRLDIYKDFPFAYHFTIFLFLFVSIYFIYSHFSKQNLEDLK